MSPVELPGPAGDHGDAPRTDDVAFPPASLLTRRQVLRGLAASGLGAGLLGSLVAACSGDAEPGSTTTAPGRTEAEDAIVQIGRRYRADHPQEDDREVLLGLLGAGVGGGPLTPSAVFPPLGEQVTEDYATGRTVQLDGWVLSLTECRAAALVSVA